MRGVICIGQGTAYQSKTLKVLVAHLGEMVSVGQYLVLKSRIFHVELAEC